MLAFAYRLFHEDFSSINGALHGYTSSLGTDCFVKISLQSTGRCMVRVCEDVTMQRPVD